jgi:DNA-binding Lrp family transcriptional regulator
MSVAAINWALNIKDVGSAEKLVLIVLSNFANEDNVAYPSITTIAEKACLSRQGVINNLKKLIDKKLIKSIEYKFIHSMYKKQVKSYALLVNEVYQSTRCTSQPDIPELVNEVDTTSQRGVPKPSCNHHDKPSCKKYIKKKSENEQSESQKIELPELDESLHKDFIDFLNNRPKAKRTSSSIRKNIEFLNKYPLHIQRQILDKSIRGGYQGLFEPKFESSCQAPPGTNVATDSLRAWVEEQEQKEQQFDESGRMFDDE